jgi:hypothetical protein
MQKPMGHCPSPEIDENQQTAVVRTMRSKKALGQTIWGTALLIAGIGVFLRVPQVMPKVESIAQFAAMAPVIRFCFYFMGALLIGGGAKKILNHYRQLSGRPKDAS